MKKTLIFLFSVLSLSAYKQAHSQTPPYVDTTKLIAWYSFSNNANDNYIHGNNGTPYNAIQTADRFGNPNSAYSFNGSSSYIQVPYNDMLNLTGSLTLSAWINTTNASSVGQVILDKLIGGTSNGWIMDLSPNPVNANQVRCIVGGVTTGLPYSTSAITLNNTWYNVVVTYDMHNVKFYVNGKLNNTIPLNSSTPTNSKPLTIGSNNTPIGTYGFWSGMLDDIGIWKRALNECEITELYLATNTLITKQPVNDTVLNGDIATFSIADTGIAGYQWQVNAGSGFTDLPLIFPYTGINTKTLTINPVSTSMSNYQYRCIRNGGSLCNDTSESASLVIKNNTGIFQQENNEIVTISPNPASNYITIKNKKNVEVIFTDMSGRQIKKSTLKVIDISDLANGIYFLSIRSSNKIDIIKLSILH